MFILDLGSRIWIFSIPYPRSWIQIFSILDLWSRIWIFSILNVGSWIRIKKFKYFYKKKWFLSSQKYDPGFPSQIRIPDLKSDFLPNPDPDPGSQIRIPGVKKAPDPWSRIRIRNTGDFWFAQAVGGSVGYCLNNSFNGSALRSFYVQQRIRHRIYLHIISLIFTVYKLWCPAHLLPNTPRMLQNRGLLKIHNILKRWRHCDVGYMNVSRIALGRFIEWGIVTLCFEPWGLT